MFPPPPGKVTTHPKLTVRQTLSFPLGKEVILPQQPVRHQVLPLILLWQLLTFLPGKEATLSRQLLTFPQVKEAVLPRLLLTFLPRKEVIQPQQAVSQAFSLTLLWQLLTFLLGKEAIIPRQLLTFPWVKEAVLPRQWLTFLLGKEAIPPRPLLSFPPVKEAVFPRPLLNLPTGKVIALPRQVSLAIQLGQSGKVVGVSPGTGHPSLPRRISLPPGKTTSLPPPSRPPQGSSNEEPNPKWVINLSNKPLTPAQRSVLAKGPNFVVTPRQPPNLE